MTIIKLHGILAKKFGSIIKLYLGNLNQVILAIDSIKPGFRSEIKKLSENGGHYTLQKDDDSTLHIIPFLCGLGRTLMIIVAVIVIIVVAVATLGAGLGASALFFGTTTVAGVAGVATVGSVMAFLAFQVALGVLISAIMFKPPEVGKMKDPAQAEYVTGGASIGAEAAGKSYVFSNINNAETQGSSIPLGYGRMKIGSKIINVSTRSYPVSYRFEDEVTINQSQSVFSSYLAF